MMNYGLEREKIPARIDKRALAKAISLAVDALVSSTETEHDDFWIGVELNVHIEAGTAPERHARVNVYAPAIIRRTHRQGDSSHSSGTHSDTSFDR